MLCKWTIFFIILAFVFYNLEFSIWEQCSEINVLEKKFKNSKFPFCEHCTVHTVQVHVFAKNNLTWMLFQLCQGIQNTRLKLCRYIHEITEPLSFSPRHVQWFAIYIYSYGKLLTILNFCRLKTKCLNHL